MLGPRSDDALVALPDPGAAGTIDDLVERLRLLKIWAGGPSYDAIKDRVNSAWSAAGRPAGELAKRATVADCFKSGRRRLNADLVIAVVEALHPDVGYAAQWRQALRAVQGEAAAAAQVRVQATLPPDLAEFTGRAAELDRLRQLGRSTAGGGAAAISVIEGMAGVGKTQLAIHAGHLLAREYRFERVLFVNLRGFHPDPAQPPADPAAVLDGFLRLLGVAGQQVPHDLGARAGRYRDLLAGTRTLVVLDNAAGADQVRPLLPAGPGSLALITSRHSLPDLDAAVHLTVDVFTRDDALEFLARAAPGVSLGDDPAALERVARRSGHLPLALGLMAAHMRAKPDWTLTDHADWLDERHRQRRLDTGVESALALSYQHQPADRRRLLRLLALHPGDDLDAYAAVALTGLGLVAARAHIEHLGREHLLQATTPGRYTFHDLVRAYAADRASDEDSPPSRRAALTRLFDYYLAGAAAAMNTLHPAEARHRPRISRPDLLAPALTDPGTARAWLDAECPILVAVAAYTAACGWPAHTVRLSHTLFRYLASGHATEALTIHGHARQAAHRIGDPAGEARALTGLGVAHSHLGRTEVASAHHEQALTLYQQAGDPIGQAHALTNLSEAEQHLGSYPSAADHLRQALSVYRQAGDRVGEGRALTNLGNVEQRLGRHESAVGHHDQALALFRQARYRNGEATALSNLGTVEEQLGRYRAAARHLQQAHDLFGELGNRYGEAWTLSALGTVHARLGRYPQAIERHEQALAVFREAGWRHGEASALLGLGEAAHASGRHTDALGYYTAAHAIAVETSEHDQQARAQTGLGHVRRALDQLADARRHYQRALTLYTDVAPEADDIRARVAALDEPGSPAQRLDRLDPGGAQCRVDAGGQADDRAGGRG